MKKIYVFSGLGTDKRTFQKIEFGVHDINFIDWIQPESDEQIESYAKRVSTGFSNEKPIIIGLSFGGMIAVEISKLIDTEKLILISSAKTKYEIPRFFRFFGQLGINRIIPPAVLKKPNRFMNWLFGVETKEDRILLNQALKDTDEHFANWALDQIARWKNSQAPENCIQIHGASDRMLPINNIKANFIIQGGGHLMIMNRAEEINGIIGKLLGN